MNLNLTLLFQVAFFIVFVWFSKRYVWPPIMGVLQERKTNIADGLAAAEKGKKAEDEARQQAQQVIADAKSQAAEIINRAEKHSGELVDQARQTAVDESARITATARAEIDTELGKAKESLREQVGELAIAGAQQILQREIDGKAHADLLTKLSAKL